MEEKVRGPKKFRNLRIMLVVVLVFYLIKQLGFFLGFLGPKPDVLLDLMYSFAYFEPNYSLGTFLAELIFPIIILVLLNRNTENSLSILVSYICSLLSVGIVLLIILITPIKYYAFTSVFYTVELYNIPTLIMYLTFDSIILVIFAINVVQLRKSL